MHYIIFIRSTETQLTYAALLAFYLHLRASEKYSARPELLRQHPILNRLLVLKQSLATLEDLSFNLSDSDMESEEEDLDDESDDEMTQAGKELQAWLASRASGLDVGELEQLLAEVNGPTKKSKSKTKKAQPPKKKRKVNDVVFDVEEPTFAKSSSKSTKAMDTADGYGEATALDVADAVDKGVRRKALRFHTAKIESASARRQGARNAMGGDDDIPYRERKKRQADKQVPKNLGEGGDDLDDAEPEQADRRRKRGRDDASDEGGSGSEDDDGYYSLVKKQKALKRAEKKAEYEAVREANR